MWLLSLIGVLSFTSCGVGSDEAKELLQRLLRLVGIPHDIVVNICQDNNNNGFCESIEPHVSIVMNQGDTAQTLWQKITETADGQYLLETYDPTKPILLELQDTDNVHYDDGKFTLNHNGFRSNETEKELSLLESMIDENHLSTQQVTAIRELEREEDQNKFYAVLLRDLETNLNTLRDIELTAIQAMAGNIKEMAEELLLFGVADTLPQRINACNQNSVCVDKILDELSKELLITDAEAQVIKQEQNGNDSNQNKIDMAKYMPTSSMNKDFISYSKTDGQEEQINTNSENYVVNDNIISINANGIIREITINKDTLVTTSPDGTQITQRYVEVGEVIFTQPLDDTFEDEKTGMKSVTTGNEVCRLGGEIDKFAQKDYIYVGNILRLDCILNSETQMTNNDIKVISKTYGNITEYIKEGIGLVAYIEDVCNESDLSSKICTHIEGYYQK